MNEDNARKALGDLLNFTQEDVAKIESFKNLMLEFNKSYNLISKSSENQIWSRHILDSAQLVKFIEFKDLFSLSDFGSGAGFPGLILAIYNKNDKFHVKLHEKSPVKAKFLNNIKEKLKIKFEVINEDVSKSFIDSNYITCRAFKKLPEIIRISREIAKKSHKLIILKGKSAQEEVNKALMKNNFEYKLENSITDAESKIILVDIKKSE